MRQVLALRNTSTTKLIAGAISLGIFTNTLSVGKKISRVNPSDSLGKSVGKDIPRLRHWNSVGNLSFETDAVH